MTNEEKLIMLEKLEKSKRYKDIITVLEGKINKLEEKIWDNLSSPSKSEIKKTRNHLDEVYFNTLIEFVQELSGVKNSKVLVEALEERAEIVKDNLIFATKPSNDSPFDISRDNLEFSSNDVDRFTRKYIKMNISMLEHLKSKYVPKEEMKSEDIY